MGALLTDLETTKTPAVVISVHKVRPEIDNRLQKRPHIQKNSPANKLPEESAFSGRDQMTMMPSLIIFDNQIEGRPEIDNRLQKRLHIEKSSPANKWPEEGALSGRDQMIIMPSLIIFDDQLEVRPEIDNRLQKRPHIEKSTPANNLPEEGALSGRDQMIIMPSLIIFDNQLEVIISDKLTDIRNTVRDLNSTIISITDNNAEGEVHVISYSKPLRAHICQSRRKLLVLDINGLLADIVSPPPRDFKSDINIARRAIFKRPNCLDFMKFCFGKFDVGIWSSRNKINVEKVTDYLFGDLKHKLLFCWDASHCTPSKFYTLENRHKTLVFKELKKIWEKHDPDLPWEKGYYNETNTLLLDDSPYKALLNPPHTAIFPYSFRYLDKTDNSLGIGGDLRVYLEGLAEADNVLDYVEKHTFGQCSITETDSSWDFYVKAVGSVSRSPSK